MGYTENLDYQILYPCLFLEQTFVLSETKTYDWFSLGTESLHLQTWEHSCVSINMSTGLVQVHSRNCG